MFKEFSPLRERERESKEDIVIGFSMEFYVDLKITGQMECVDEEKWQPFLPYIHKFFKFEGAHIILYEKNFSFIQIVSLPLQITDGFITIYVHFLVRRTLIPLLMYRTLMLNLFAARLINHFEIVLICVFTSMNYL